MNQLICRSEILLFLLSKPMLFFPSQYFTLCHSQIYLFFYYLMGHTKNIILTYELQKCFHKSLYPSQIQKKNVYHVCKQRKRFFYFVTHLCVFTSGLRMRKEKENHISLSIRFQSLIFPNKDPSKPYLPTRCYSLSLQKYTEHYFKAKQKKKNSERKIHKSLHEFLNNKLYMSLQEI